LRETPFVQDSTTWALTCPETVHQRPHMTREIETWLSDSRVGNNSVADDRSRPGFFVGFPDLEWLRLDVEKHFRFPTLDTL